MRRRKLPDRGAAESALLCVLGVCFPGALAIAFGANGASAQLLGETAAYLRERFLPTESGKRPERS